MEPGGGGAHNEAQPAGWRWRSNGKGTLVVSGARSGMMYAGGGGAGSPHGVWPTDPGRLAGHSSSAWTGVSVPSAWRSGLLVSSGTQTDGAPSIPPGSCGLAPCSSLTSQHRQGGKTNLANGRRRSRAAHTGTLPVGRQQSVT